MLKIKDDYDLNNLKKYGFEHEEGIISLACWDYWVIKLEWAEFLIDTKDRIIDVFAKSDSFGIELDILYDMIQDGIVEKESEA